MKHQSVLVIFMLSLIGCGQSSSSIDTPQTSGTASETVAVQPEVVKPDPEQTTSEASPEQKRVVSLTPQAVEKLQELQVSEENPYLRVAVKFGGPTGFMYEFNFDDQIDVEQDYLDASSGLIVLVDRRSALYIEGTTIDWMVTESGEAGFKFNNPNAAEK